MRRKAMYIVDRESMTTFTKHTIINMNLGIDYKEIRY